MGSRAQGLLPHMRDALATVSARLRQTDVVLELRDARLPFSSENRMITELIATKPRQLLVFSKSDLAHSALRKVKLHHHAKWGDI